MKRKKEKKEAPQPPNFNLALLLRNGLLSQDCISYQSPNLAVAHFDCSLARQPFLELGQLSVHQYSVVIESYHIRRRLSI